MQLTTSKNRIFTHDEVFEIGGEYYKCKTTGEWVSEINIVDWPDERLSIQVAEYEEMQADKYF